MPTNAINDTGVKYIYDKLDAKKVDKEPGKGLSTNDYTNADKSKVGKIDETTTSISGNPISISGLKANQLAVNPIITLEPIQAGSGTPSPSNIRAISGYDKVEVLSCGANLCPAFDTHTAINGAGQKYTYDASSLSKTPIKLFKGVTYYSYIKYSPFTVTPSPYVHKFDANGSYLGYNTIPSNGTVTFDDDVAYIYIQLNKNGTITEDVSTIQYNFYLSDTSINGHYYPYVKATSISESLGQTVYGGTLDVRTGKFTVEFVKKIYDGSSDETWTKDRQSFYIAENTLPKELTYTTNIIKCDRLQTVERSSLIGTGEVTNAISGYKDTSSSYPNQNWIYVGVSGISDVASLKTWLSNNPIEVTFKIINSAQTTIQLTPHEISLLKDYAYLSTNGTSIALDYHNGELASLGDVSQLGETLNELGSEVTALKGNKSGGATFITTSYTESNPYTFDADGYVVVSSESSASGYIRVMIKDSTNTANLALMYMNANGTYEMQSTYVRKGMKAYISVKTATDATVTFRRLTS